MENIKTKTKQTINHKYLQISSDPCLTTASPLCNSTKLLFCDKVETHQLIQDNLES